MRTSGDKKEKLPIKNDEESSLVAESGEISNLDLLEDIFKILEIMESVNSVY
jgi:hypothetical protein